MSGCGLESAVNSSGSVTIPVSISGAASGKVFKYQLNGPAGFTSGFVTTTFNSSGGGGSTPEVCVGDATTICAPITRLSATSAGKQIPIVYNDSTRDGTANIPTSTTSISYQFSFPTDYTNKNVFVQFFDIDTLSLTVPGGSINSSTSCDPQPAGAKPPGCKLQVDADGKASFTIFVSNASLGANFKYHIAGPNYESKFVLTTVADAPVVAPTVSVTTGKAKFTVNINNANGLSATVKYKVGNKQKTSTSQITSDAAHLKISVKKGTYSVTIRVGSLTQTKRVKVS